MTPFYILGGVLAAWALVVTALGVRSKDFPGSRSGERAVIAISVLLVAGAIGAAVIGAANEEEEPGEEAHAAEAGQQPAGGSGGQAPADAEHQGAPDGEAPAGAAQRVELGADPQGQLAFTEKTLEAGAGAVEIVMANPATVPHNVAIEGSGVDEEGEIVGEGETSTVEADLEPGEYTFYCSVPGHRQSGMEGTLTVE